MGGNNNTFYLRVEGVNLDNFVYDTDNLSTIRGGGLMLLEIPEKVEKLLEKDASIKNVEPISKGASWGLFSFELKNQNEDLAAKDVAESIKKDLNNELDLYRENFNKEILVIGPDKKVQARQCIRECILDPKHATVMLEVYRPDPEEDFEKIREKLASLVRWRQMRSPSIAFPSVVKTAETDLPRKVCELDYFRPAEEKAGHKINGKERVLSASTHARYDYGVWGKSDKWYEKVTGLDIPYLFTHELGELAASYDDDTLNRKMAVIYLDGNRFGKILAELCKSQKDQTDFDETLREKYQAGALGALIQKMIEDEDGWINCNCSFPELAPDEKTPKIRFETLLSFPELAPDEKTPKIRFETLLWGGDEVIWVAPAWRGWWLLGQYFHLVEGGLDGSCWNFKGKPLTFAAGLVFCNHKAPIYRIKDMAIKLAGEVKAVNRNENMVAYEVMESFDFSGPDLAKIRERRRPKNISKKDMLIKGANMLEIAEIFLAIKDKIPKRALHRAVHDGQEESLSRLNSAIDAAFNKQDKSCLDCLKKCFSGEEAMWLHLYELWDYLILPYLGKTKGATQAAGSGGGEEDVQG